VGLYSILKNVYALGESARLLSGGGIVFNPKNVYALGESARLLSGGQTVFSSRVCGYEQFLKKTALICTSGSFFVYVCATLCCLFLLTQVNSLFYEAAPRESAQELK
jgi:hypothetical protein